MLAVGFAHPSRHHAMQALQVSEYNRQRYENLISAGWDLIIVDEAHRLGGSTDQVARHKLGQRLAEAAPYFLLLSATPHQGKTDSFHRLMSLIDRDAFPDEESITRECVSPYVIRTEKRNAIDAEGNPLFKPRRTQMNPISWDQHYSEKLLYDAVTEYVREGYDQAIREKRNCIGFLMILMQRLVASSTRAIRATLERRLEILETPEGQLPFFPDYSEEEWVEFDGQEQTEMLSRTRLSALENECDEVKELLNLARQCDRSGPDVKAVALLDWIYRLQQEEGQADLKILIFTEFVPTQEMLSEFLMERGFSIVRINGSMDMNERRRAQESFAKDARILISTDAGGEGLNLQFCHVVINYDIPWNPMRLEQRIGRVDRIGQERVVRAVNFVLKDSVEYRVLGVLQEKLAVIFNDLGIDKTSDVLDSVLAVEIFDDLYVNALLNPDDIDKSVSGAVTRIETHARETRESTSVLGKEERLDPAQAERLLSHPLPYWIERMTVSYIQSLGSNVARRIGGWTLHWANSFKAQNVVFTREDLEVNPTAEHLTLEDARIRGLVMRLPRAVCGQPIPVIQLSGIPRSVYGFWSLWEVSIYGDDWSRRRVIPLFLHDDKRVLIPTARRIWDELLLASIKVRRVVERNDSHQVFGSLREVAETHGRAIYEELVGMHHKWMTEERQKWEYSFEARLRAIERIGLATVRNYRRRELEHARQAWEQEMSQRSRVTPELMPLTLIRVEAGERDE